MSPHIPEAEREKVSEILKDMDQEVHVTVLTRPAVKLVVPGLPQRTYQETADLVAEVAELAPKIKLDVIDVMEKPEALAEHGIKEPPAIVLSRNGGSNLRFLGLPGGYEFSTFLQSLLIVSGVDAGLPEEFAQEVRDLTEPLHIEVFVTPT